MEIDTYPISANPPHTSQVIKPALGTVFVTILDRHCGHSSAAGLHPSGSPTNTVICGGKVGKGGGCGAEGYGDGGRGGASKVTVSDGEGTGGMPKMPKITFLNKY